MSTDAFDVNRHDSTIPQAFESGADAFGMSGFGPGTSDPNTSYELRDMVSVAATYFERGMVNDANEMLQEALEAGYSLPDAIELNLRIRAILGNGSLPDAPPPAQTTSNTWVRDFTIPLPGEDSQGLAVRRAISESEADILAGRLHAACDATLYTLSIAPSYFPMYFRLAEVRRALGYVDGAAEIVSTLRECLSAWADDADWRMLSLRVVIDPSDQSALRTLARSLLSQRGAVQLEPFVPDAIECAIVHEPSVAIDMATEYLELRPDVPRAVTLFLRAVISGGDIDAIGRAVVADVNPDCPADLLFMRGAFAYSRSHDDWLNWIELAVARLLRNPEEAGETARAIDAARQVLPSAQHGLAAAIIRLAAGEHALVPELLSPWQGTPRRETSNVREMLLAACARAFAYRQMSPIEAIPALAAAVSHAVVIDVRPYSESARVFAHSITAEALMAELVAVARETGQQETAIQHLQALRDRLPEHLEIRTGLADLQVAAGRVSEGVRELRYIAERYEQSGNMSRMVDAMRHISSAVPNNAEMKSKLIDGYLQRGIPDEATRELRLLGDLHLKRGRGADAAMAYARGADIAATTGGVRRAMDLFDRAVAADPENVGVRHAAVAFHVMNGSVDHATRQLREIVRIALSLDDPDEAVAALHQIIGLSPSDTTAYHGLGEVLTSLGEYTQAERVYRRLATLTPDDPVLSAKQSALAALAAGK
ncbi:MAG TPA: tetratricopeptide repeat protein [Thermomicrobiales bacterium]|nr:tetratricopeptide repeat protein [Thermomicrobiales bacterium]